MNLTLNLDDNLNKNEYLQRGFITKIDPGQIWTKTSVLTWPQIARFANTDREYWPLKRAPWSALCLSDKQDEFISNDVQIRNIVFWSTLFREPFELNGPAQVLIPIRLLQSKWVIFVFLFNHKWVLAKRNSDNVKFTLLITLIFAKQNETFWTK